MTASYRVTVIPGDGIGPDVTAAAQRVLEDVAARCGFAFEWSVIVVGGAAIDAYGTAIRDEDLASLVAIPGVGRKTAERMVVDLRDKIGLLALTSGVEAAAPRVGPLKSERAQDAVAALVRLGYSATQAQDAVRNIADEGGTLSLEDLVRRALARLGKATVGAR